MNRTDGPAPDPGPLWAACLIGVPVFALGLLSPVVVSAVAAWGAGRLWGLSQGWQWGVVVVLSIVLYGLLGLWGEWLGSDRRKAEMDRRARAAGCPVCHGWSGSLVLTGAEPRTMCDRHRAASERIRILEQMLDGTVPPE